MDTNLQPLIDAARKWGEAEFLSFEDHASTDRAVISVPEANGGRKIVSLKPFMDEYLDHPERIVQRVTHLTHASLIDYVVRFKREDTSIFVDDSPGASSITAVMDYHHRMTGDETEHGDLPDWCKHVARYEFPLSAQMKVWIALANAPNGGFIDQTAFANLLEDRFFDIAPAPLDWMALDMAELTAILSVLNLESDHGYDDGVADEAPLPEDADADDDRYIPRSALYKLRKIRFGSPRRILDLSRGISIASTTVVRDAFNPRTGERTVVFSEDHESVSNKDGRKVTVPEMFLVRIPVFEGGPRHLMPVRLQYRKNGTRANWKAELVDAPGLVRAAVRAIVSEVKEKTEAPLYLAQNPVAR